MFKIDKPKLEITVSSITMIKAIAIVIGSLIFLSIIKTIAPALLLLFISFLLALTLNPTVSFISKKLKNKSRIQATGIAYILVITFLVSFSLLVFPPLIKQSVDFVKEVPSTLQNAQSESSSTGRFISRYNLQDDIDQFASDFADKFKDSGKPILDTAGAVLTAVASTIVVLVLTFMMLVEGPRWIEKFFAIQPKQKREKYKVTAHRMYKTVTSYVNGQVLIAFIDGFFALIAILILSTIFGVDVNYIALAGIITLFALLPLIGTTIGAVIVVISTLFVSTPLAISLIIFFIVYQQIENVTIQPYIQSRNNNLTPLIVFSSAIIGATLAGILGAFIAIPTAACIKILLEEHYKNRIESVK